MMTQDEINEWVDRYFREELSSEERTALRAWLEASPEHARLLRWMFQTEMRVSAAGKWRQLDRMQERVWERVSPILVSRRKRLYLWGMRVAAIILVLMGMFFVWQIPRNPEKKVLSDPKILQVEAGSAKAILVTNTGEKIELKKGASRQVVDILGVGVIQDSTGVRLVDRGDAEERIGNSTVVVPEKGEYFVVLSDGTKVWINSASELEFPNRFIDNTREVKLKGEAYFEVMSNPQQPFYVLVGETRVHVLGTAFNVSAYQEDRQTEIALLRGKVSFEVSDKEVYVLTPGEIATLDRESGKTTLRKGDVTAVVDWKAGRFNFEDMPLEELAVKLSRWYGVPFVFGDDAAKKLRFSGAVTKYRTLDYILEMISKTTDVTFGQEEGKVIVSLKR